MYISLFYPGKYKKIAGEPNKSNILLVLLSFYPRKFVENCQNKITVNLLAILFLYP